MFNLFRKKPSLSNGWIKLPRGADIPEKVGQLVDIRFDNGREVYRIVFGQSGQYRCSDGAVARYNASLPLSVWFIRGSGSKMFVTHYRLHKPEEISDETAARAHMDNRIRDWCKDPGPEIERDRYRKAQPAKKREGIRHG